MFGLVRKEKVFARIEEEIRNNWRKVQHFTQLLEEATDENTKRLYQEKIKYYQTRRDEATRIFGYVRHV